RRESVDADLAALRPVLRYRQSAAWVLCAGTVVSAADGLAAGGFRVGEESAGPVGGAAAGRHHDAGRHVRRHESLPWTVERASRTVQRLAGIRGRVRPSLRGVRRRDATRRHTAVRPVDSGRAVCIGRFLGRSWVRGGLHVCCDLAAPLSRRILTSWRDEMLCMRRALFSTALLLVAGSALAGPQVMV